MTIVHFHGHPDAMERIEQRKTQSARQSHDEGMRGLRPIRPVLYLDSSASARAVRFFLHLARWLRLPRR